MNSSRCSHTNWLWLVTVIVLLSACSYYETTDESSVYYAVPVGSSLVLNQDVSISGDQVATFVQRGEIMTYDMMLSTNIHRTVNLKYIP